MTASTDDARPRANGAFAAKSVIEQGLKPRLFDDLGPKRPARAGAAVVEDEELSGLDDYPYPPAPSRIASDMKAASNVPSAESATASPLRRTIEALRSSKATSTAMVVTRDAVAHPGREPEPLEASSAERIESLETASSACAQRLEALEKASAELERDKAGRSEAFAELKCRLSDLEDAAESAGLLGTSDRRLARLDLRSAIGVVFLPALVFGTTFGFAMAVLFYL